MSFPLTPANNQVTLENGIAYTYNASRGAWFRTPATALASLTSNTFTVLNSIIFADGTSQTTAANPTDTFARTTANTATNNITILQGVNTDQNNRITIAEGVDVGQNTRMSIIEGVNTTQNTDITAANTRAQAAFNTANSALSQSNSALTAISAISSIRVSTSNTTPVSANVGDQWYYPPTDTIYRFTNDGVKNWWIDVSGISIQNNDIPLRPPGAPTSVSATATSNGTASISFTAPTDTGFPINAITSYTVTSNTGISVTGSSSPLTIVGLTPEITYTFTVVATNRAGSGVASANTNSIVALGAPPTQVTYAVQGAGGGGGGGYPSPSTWGGGGGAGGIYLSGTLAVAGGSTYGVTVGAGGSGGSVPSPSNSVVGTAGGSSVFHNITATGGGRGGNATNPRGGDNASYSAGGPGGNDYSGSGGAGSAGNGSPADSRNGGPGGSGSLFPQGFYTGGGGGGGSGNSVPFGGLGTGGSPGNFGTAGQGGGTNGSAQAGAANRGGGGGGAQGGSSNGQGGGSGIVSVSYPTQFASAVSASGATYEIISGTLRRYTWNSSGSITF
jgi:hypothetical protein